MNIYSKVHEPICRRLTYANYQFLYKQYCCRRFIMMRIVCVKDIPDAMNAVAEGSEMMRIVDLLQRQTNCDYPTNIFLFVSYFTTLLLPLQK